jgi:hypothetical protein
MQRSYFRQESQGRQAAEACPDLEHFGHFGQEQCENLFSHTQHLPLNPPLTIISLFSRSYPSGENGIHVVNLVSYLNSLLP